MLCLPTGGSSGLVAMNAVLVPSGLPAYRVHSSNPSVPTHPAAPTTTFSLVHAFVLFVAAGQWTGSPCGDPRIRSFVGLGPGFAQRSQARRSAWLYRVFVASCLTCHVVSGGVFTSRSSPPRVSPTQ